jgi:hypothetical protein
MIISSPVAVFPSQVLSHLSVAGLFNDRFVRGLMWGHFWCNMPVISGIATFNDHLQGYL